MGGAASKVNHWGCEITFPCLNLLSFLRLVLPHFHPFLSGSPSRSRICASKMTRPREIEKKMRG